MSDVRELLVRRAADVGTPDLDLDALVAAGDRRVRRRRTAAALGVAAAVAAVVGLVVLPGSGRDGSAPAPPAGTPTGAPSVEHRRIAWTEAGPSHRVHLGTRVVDLSDLVAQVPRVPGDVERGMVYLDNSATGLVMTTHDGRIWFTDGGAPQAIGRLGGMTSIISDDTVVTGTSGSLAAWYDATQDAFVVHDTARGERVALIPCPECIGEVRGGAPGLAVVGDHVYWPRVSGSGRRLMRWDAGTGDSRPTTRSAYLEDVRHTPRGLVVGDSFESGTPSSGFGVSLYPPAGGRGAYVAESGRVFDTLTGQELRLHLPVDRAPAATIFDWLDDRHLVLQGESAEDPFFVCRVPAGPCRLADPGEGFRRPAHLTFP